MPLAKLVAQNLFGTRTRRKLSQQTVAEKAGLSVSYISMLERGVRVPPLETLEAVAKALGVPPLDLLHAGTSKRSRSSRR
jgi:transcriptional regulator with XRE-family HTH domain